MRHGSHTQIVQFLLSTALDIVRGSRNAANVLRQVCWFTSDPSSTTILAKCSASDVFGTCFAVWQNASDFFCRFRIVAQCWAHVNSFSVIIVDQQKFNFEIFPSNQNKIPNIIPISTLNSSITIPIASIAMRSRWSKLSKNRMTFKLFPQSHYTHWKMLCLYVHSHIRRSAVSTFDHQ